MAKGEALKGHIEALRNAIPELKGVLLASNEGLPIAHSLSNGSDPNRVAAMAAAASSLGRRISESMSSGTLGEVSIQAEEGALFIYSAGSKAVLAVMSPQGGNAGLIHLEARGAAKEIGDLFFSVVNLARKLKVDGETALHRATDKFATRFRAVEALARERGLALDKMTLAELDALWDEVKRQA